MRKIFILMVCVLCPLKAEAFVYLGETYTGRTAGAANDTPFFPNQFGYTPLGGVVGNQAVRLQARQFIVDQKAHVHYLSVTGLMVPSWIVFENARSEYIHDRLAQGATPEEIGAELVSFVGPAQSFTVSFDLIEGSVPWNHDLPLFTPLPSQNVLATTTHTFWTDNSRDNTQFEDVWLKWGPPSRKLNPDETYWIMARAGSTGPYFSYTTEQVGKFTNPEPASILLMGGGLLGLLGRRRKAKVS